VTKKSTDSGRVPSQSTGGCEGFGFLLIIEKVYQINKSFFYIIKEHLFFVSGNLFSPDLDIWPLLSSTIRSLTWVPTQKP